MSELDRGDDHRWGVDSDSWTHRGSGVYCTRCHHPGDGVMNSPAAGVILCVVGLVVGAYMTGGMAGIGLALIVLSVLGLIWIMLNHG